MPLPPDRSDILVFGASGQIGCFLLPRLAGFAARILAISRGAAPKAASDEPITWLQGDLFQSDCPSPAAATVIALGPLDGLAAWLERDKDEQRVRLIAFSSTSVMSKRHSTDPNEQALAERLATSEQRVIALCQARNIAWTLFRPTMIYGAGRDRNLTRIAQLARRFRLLPMPFPAPGLRAPVHAEDLAAACVAALPVIASHRKIYTLTGGESLPYGRMLQRLRASLGCWVLSLPIPLALIRMGVAAMRALTPGRQELALGAGFDRLAQDLAFDSSEASHDFGYAPRGFSPTANTWITHR